MKRAVLWLLLALALPFAAPAQDEQPRPALAALDGEQQARYRQMISELRCLVCQNQTIADSSAPLAKDLRDQVERQIAEGRSDDEIRQYMVARYGDFVLYKPPMQRNTLVLWGGPFLLLLVALFAAVRHMRRRGATAPAPAAPADAQALQKLLDEERP